MKTRILLVDDHKIFRAGIHSLLDRQPDMTVVGEAEDGRMAVELAQRLSPQVVVMDMTMPSLNGVDATRRILAHNPGVKVVALSMHAHRRYVQEMLGAGARGYLLKECAFEELVQAIHAVVDRNQTYLSPEIAQVVVDEYLQVSRKEKEPDAPALSPREREILQLVAEGNTSEDIAEILHMSRRTVEKHRSAIMAKLKVSSLAELVKYAIREGLTTL